MENTFYNNKNYIELKKKLNFKDSQILIQVIGEAIQYGIDALAEQLTKGRK